AHRARGLRRLGLRPRALLRAAALRLSPISVLRLPLVRELFLLEPVRLLLRALSDRGVRRSVLLPLSLLRRDTGGVHTPAPARAALHLQGPAGIRRVRHARARPSRGRQPAPRGPRPAPRAEPRREVPPPKSEPRVEPKRDAPKDKPRAEPELKRRKP